MAFSTRLVVGGAVMGAALTYYVRKKRRETGQGYVGILRGLPGDARRWADQTKDRAARALEEGKAAARDRDAEFARQLEAASSPSDL